jgi:hypothetical protein
MIPGQCIEVQTSPLERPSVPPWFAEVTLLSQHLARKGLLETFTHQIRLVRGHFGHDEPIDFLVLLIGYAISGERTVADFFERLAPFGEAFMALFGRASLPHRSSLSRFLADVDGPCLEAFRTLFEQFSFPEGWTSETIGGIFDRQGRRYLGFDVDATRQAARQRALPCDPTLPPAKRRLDAVCAPGYKGRKRGEVVRTRTTARRDAYPSLGWHRWGARQWRLSAGIGLGPACHRDLLEALRSHPGGGSCAPRWALWRRGGDRSTRYEAGVYLITRGRTYGMLERPQRKPRAHPSSKRTRDCSHSWPSR